MPVLRQRRKRRTIERQNSSSRFTRGIVALGLALAASVGLVIIAGAFVYASLTADLPSPELLPALLDPANGVLLQPTRLYDRTGQHILMTLAPEDGLRRYVPIDEAASEHLPEDLQRVTVALADPEFWTHPGFRLDDLYNPNSHATLAQKLVSDLLLWNETPGLRRAIRERILASQITSRYGRKKVLEWYLNSAGYGHYTFGAESASRLYLGKPVSGINLAEAALLASVNQTPAINPLDAPQAALQRQGEALNLLQSRGILTPAEAGAARLSPIKIMPAPRSTDLAPAFTALVISQLENRFSGARIDRGGLRVITTLDYDLQTRSTCATLTELGQDASLPGSSCIGAENLPPLPPGENTPASASVVVLDPTNGQLLALVGDIKNGVDPGYLTPHRPGTLLTPFIYLAGFTRGLSPASLVWDLPPQNPAPTDSSHTYLGPVRLRKALTSDSLTTAAQVLDQMGAGLVQQTMAPFGLDIPASNLKTLLESDKRFSIIQVARAYGIFAAQGQLAGQPGGEALASSVILSVRGLDDQSFADWSQPISGQVVSAQLAYLVNDVLGVNISALGRPAALKTGLTPDGAETWAAGYTPRRVVVVWMGGDRLTQRPVSDLWSAIMQSASADVPPDNWPLPPGMLRLKVCDPSGMLPGPACQNVVNEIFIEGYQPVQADTLFRAYAINRETGLLATVFTPDQLVEKRIFMNVPPEAQAWARSANLPVPPTQYDNIQPPAPDPQAFISFPAMFSELGGKLSITGGASGSDFSYYRLQYGQGLNPESWTQIGSDVNTAVLNGKLAEWDTSGLKGLYSLQLLVVRTDHSLQKATVQVSLTNP